VNRALCFGALGLLVLEACLGWTAPGPQLPCEGNRAYPPQAERDQPPAVKVWERHSLGAHWTPPACTGWTDSGFSSLVTVSGRFQGPSSVEGMLRRIGAISDLKGVQYWSTTHQHWKTLIVDAFALSGPSGARREDFSPGDLAGGRPVQFEQEDSLSGKGRYELQVSRAADDRIVFETRNLTTLHFLLVPVFHPGDLQSVYFLQREGKDVWTYYNIARVGENASSLVAGHAASSINRAVAFYRHLAGIPTNQEPPAAR